MPTEDDLLVAYGAIAEWALKLDADIPRDEAWAVHRREQLNEALNRYRDLLAQMQAEEAPDGR